MRRGVQRLYVGGHAFCSSWRLSGNRAVICTAGCAHGSSARIIIMRAKRMESQ
ncbi:hypothetical protein GPEL0_01r1305 [Geoanaerobacter pelophilus]|uniref:Uncharacterized protein n=1 Tax=Geoanaerobacter pelophilus TaxID=60036 RepID=A0ABQ0MG66_9BACT|nr:hypothetical protein GPEL0_01r1305 [Geoanaerobacter pelophilus]